MKSIVIALAGKGGVGKTSISAAIVRELVKKHKDKRIAVFTHGYAITSYLLKYCKLIHISEERLEVEYNGKTLYNKRLNAPEVFKLTFDNQELKNIELIEFDDLPYNHGV